MPKVAKTSGSLPVLSAIPPKYTPVSGCDMGYDLRGVDSRDMVAELCRRGECPTLQPAGRSNVVPVKPVKKLTLFG